MSSVERNTSCCLPELQGLNLLPPLGQILMLEQHGAAPPSTCSSEVKELHLTKQPLIVPLWQMGMSKTNFQI